MNWKTFLKGLLAAAIGGAATYAASAATTPGMNGKQIGVMAGTGAALAVAAYLKQSPIGGSGK